LSFDYRLFLSATTDLPGVYFMLDINDKIIYIGKAKNLKNRLTTYFNKASDNKTIQMVQQIGNIKTTITETENEALVLENNLIKKHRPKYNILFKDDKSYPYIKISDDNYPQFKLYRGVIKKRGKFYGPYPNTTAAKSTLSLLQKIFKIRLCENTVFNNRSRACLLHQIDRCSAPCVSLISDKSYQDDVQNATSLIDGKDDKIIKNLIKNMEQASSLLLYEDAVIYRNKIQFLQKIRQEQKISGIKKNIDIIACIKKDNKFCICVFYIRDNKNEGNRIFYPKSPIGEIIDNVLYAFISKYYLESGVPDKIIINQKIIEQTLLEQNIKCKISNNPKNFEKKILNLSIKNAQLSLNSFLNSKFNMLNKFKKLTKILKLKQVPQLIECFDISHLAGTDTVASCVVFDNNGACKKLYRKYNITGIKESDDYAAMRQVLQRRYSRLLKEDKDLPDILLVDGGAGQLQQAKDILDNLGIESVLPIGLFKGEKRLAACDRILLPTGEKISFMKNEGFYLLQQIRDESHRFAILSHKAKRAKRIKSSILKNIPGISDIRSKNLLQYFGGIDGIKSASIQQLEKVPGIKTNLALTIYQQLHKK